jgi:hypothetical protein
MTGSQVAGCNRHYQPIRLLGAAGDAWSQERLLDQSKMVPCQSFTTAVCDERFIGPAVSRKSAQADAARALFLEISRLEPPRQPLNALHVLRIVPVPKPRLGQRCLRAIIFSYSASSTMATQRPTRSPSVLQGPRDPKEVPSLCTTRRRRNATRSAKSRWSRRSRAVAHRREAV